MNKQGQINEEEDLSKMERFSRPFQVIENDEFKKALDRLQVKGYKFHDGLLMLSSTDVSFEFPPSNINSDVALNIYEVQVMKELFEHIKKH